MYIINGGRHCGKTTKCIEMLKNNPNAIYVCGLKLMQEYIIKEFPQLKQRIYTIDTFLYNRHKMLENTKLEIILDDANDIIEKLLSDFFGKLISTIVIYDDSQDRKWGGIWQNPYMKNPS